MPFWISNSLSWFVLVALQVALARRGAGRVEVLGRALIAVDWLAEALGALLAEPTYFMPISAASVSDWSSVARNE